MAVRASCQLEQADMPRDRIGHRLVRRGEKAEPPAGLALLFEKAQQLLVIGQQSRIELDRARPPPA